MRRKERSEAFDGGAVEGETISERPVTRVGEGVLCDAYYGEVPYNNWEERVDIHENSRISSERFASNREREHSDSTVADWPAVMD